MRDNLHNKHNKQFSLHEKIMKWGGMESVGSVESVESVGQAVMGVVWAPFLPSNRASNVFITY